MRVPFVDLKAQYATIKQEIDDSIRQVVDSCAFAGGPFVAQFEKAFAEVHGAKHCVAVNSGTAALHLAFWAGGVGLGDEVIVPTNTFFATAEAVSLTGATPVFVDCEAQYYNVDADGLEAAITERTKAICAVHLYGQPAQMLRVQEIATRHDLLLVEDCAQAHLATLESKPVGTTGSFGCFSFYPGKNLGAYGDAGAVLTNNEDALAKMAALRDHGSAEKYVHHAIGHNYRMGGIQGSVLSTKLRHLHGWTSLRRRHAELYRSCLQGVKQIVLPAEMPGASHVYHLFVVRAQRRDELATMLRERGIDTGLHYPTPCHRQRAYEQSAQRASSLPVAEQLAAEILSLPMYAELSEEAIRYVCEMIREFYDA